MPQLCGRRRQPSAPPHTFHRTCLNPSTDGALLAQTRFTQVLYIFANEWTRSELDRLCHEAQLAAKSSRPKKKSPAVCAQAWPWGELGGDYAYQSGYSFRMYRVIVLVFAAALEASKPESPCVPDICSSARAATIGMSDCSRPDRGLSSDHSARPTRQPPNWRRTI